MRASFLKGIIHKVYACSLGVKTSGQLTFCRSGMSGDCRPSVIFILGPPGSGKGTQCTNITERFNFEHLSAGDLLRNEKNIPGSPFGSLIEEHLKNGRIVPAEITYGLLEREMHLSKLNFFLIDGFPRNPENLKVWEKEMSEKVNLLGVLFFDCEEDVCIDRCLSRGSAGSGRSDDNLESLRKRFITYKSDTMPVVEYFDKKKLVFKIDSNRGPKEIFSDVEKVLKDVAPLSVKN